MSLPEQESSDLFSNEELIALAKVIDKAEKRAPWFRMLHHKLVNTLKSHQAPKTVFPHSYAEDNSVYYDTKPYTEYILTEFELAAVGYRLGDYLERMSEGKPLVPMLHQGYIQEWLRTPVDIDSGQSFTLWEFLNRVAARHANEPLSTNEPQLDAAEFAQMARIVGNFLPLNDAFQWIVLYQIFNPIRDIEHTYRTKMQPLVLNYVSYDKNPKPLGYPQLKKYDAHLRLVTVFDDFFRQSIESMQDVDDPRFEYTAVWLEQISDDHSAAIAARSVIECNRGLSKMSEFIQRLRTSLAHFSNPNVQEIISHTEKIYLSQDEDRIVSLDEMTALFSYYEHPSEPPVDYPTAVAAINPWIKNHAINRIHRISSDNPDIGFLLPNLHHIDIQIFDSDIDIIDAGLYFDPVIEEIRRNLHLIVVFDNETPYILLQPLQEGLEVIDIPVVQSGIVDTLYQAIVASSGTRAHEEIQPNEEIHIQDKSIQIIPNIKDSERAQLLEPEIIRALRKKQVHIKVGQETDVETKQVIEPDIEAFLEQLNSQLNSVLKKLSYSPNDIPLPALQKALRDYYENHLGDFVPMKLGETNFKFYRLEAGSWRIILWRPEGKSDMVVGAGPRNIVYRQTDAIVRRVSQMQISEQNRKKKK